MESIENDQDDKSIEELSFEKLSYLYENPKRNPRVGGEYQVEIPPLISESMHHQLLMNPFDSEGIIDTSHSFVMDLNDPWTDAEVDSFILGLYIFGKNFVQIKRFIENKEMGEILSFYYGEFYKSSGYRRWSDGRKTKRKQCIYGKRIFTGRRQKELFFRLYPHVPKHLQNTFQEVSMAFTKRKISLEDYVSNLKATVGIQALVETVGIGKGKEDLTGLAMQPVKSNPLFQQSHCYLKPQISTCSLHHVKFTVDDSRVVHGKNLRETICSQDDLNVTSLVTSSSNKTEKIFSEDSLGENELDAVDMSLDVEKKINNAISSEGASNGYGSSCTKFTIMDTSFPRGVKSSRSREFGYSPLDFKASSETITSSVENEGASRDEHNTRLKGERNIHKSNSGKSISDSSTHSNQKAVDSDTTKEMEESLQDQSNVSNDPKLISTIKHQFSQSGKSGHSNCLVPLMEWQRLTSCSKTEISHVIESSSVGLGSNEVASCSALNPQDAANNAFEVSQSQEKLSSTSSLAEVFPEDCYGMETSQRENVEHQCPLLIDLNLPADSDENAEHVLMEVENSHEKNANNTCFPSNSDNLNPMTLSTSVDVTPAAEHPDLNPRRKSTRNRPLTNRALEAFECGFLGVKKRQKRTGQGIHFFKSFSHHSQQS